MNATEHISLNFPIEHDGLPISKVALHHPTVRSTCPSRKLLTTMPGEFHSFS